MTTIYRPECQSLTRSLPESRTTAPILPRRCIVGLCSDLPMLAVAATGTSQFTETIIWYRVASPRRSPMNWPVCDRLSQKNSASRRQNRKGGSRFAETEGSRRERDTSACPKPTAEIAIASLPGGAHTGSVSPAIPFLGAYPERGKEVWPADRRLGQATSIFSIRTRV